MQKEEKITLEKYPEIIKLTAVYPQSVDHFEFAYAGLGIADEFLEVLDKIQELDETDLDYNEKIGSEIGDVLWYLCLLCVSLNLSFEEIINEALKEYKLFPKKEAKIKDINIFGDIKKFYRDGKSLNLHKKLVTLCNFFIYMAFEDETDNIDSKIEEILHNNYQKLIKRRETNTIHGDGDDRENLKYVFKKI